MKEEAAALAGRIDGRRMRELLVDFANVQGVGDRPHVAAEWFAGLLRASGAVEARVYRRGMAGPAVAAGFPGMSRAPTLQFMGYFAAPGAGCGKAYTAAGAVHGRAVASTAAGLIAAVEAARILATHGPMPGGGLLFTAHPAGTWTQTASDIGVLMDVGVVGQAVVITSGDSNLIAVAGQGTCLFEVEFLLPSTSVTADNAQSTVIDAAHTFYRALKRRRSEAAYAVDALTGPDTIVVGRMGGGEGYDSSPRSSWLQGAWRYGPGRTAVMVHEELNLLAQRIAAASGTLVKLTLNVLRPPYCLDPAASLVQTLQRACREVWGRDLPKGRATYPSDVPLFLARGVPAICHGPRPGVHSGGDEECVSMEDVSRLAEVYLRLSLAYLRNSGEAANGLVVKAGIDERAMVYSTCDEPELVTQGSIA